MNVVLPEKPRILNRRNVTYMTILIVCAVAIAIAVYQFFSEEKLGVLIGITDDSNEEINELKADFNNLFTNEFKMDQQAIIKNDLKIEKDKELVYTYYKKDEKSGNNYTLDVEIPYININNETAKRFNEKIQKSFQQPAEDILHTEERNIIYTTNYTAFLENDILTVAILSTFKEGDGAQRTIFNTYNYNIKNNKEATIADFMSIKDIDENTLANSIKSEIKRSQEKIKQLKELGYDIFERNVTDEMYDVKNISNCFIYDDHLYIIYAYGNTNTTSEMDIVII